MTGSVLVTGGSKGIGLAIAERFLAEKFAVTVCARGTAALAELACRNLGMEAVVCDLTDEGEIDRLAEQVTRRHGALDVLVNNSGEFLPGRIHDEPEGNLEAMLSANLLGAYRLTRRLLPGMIARRRGTIINVCSTASIMGYPNGGSYCIAKHGLHGFSRTLREELKPLGIRVVSLLPGATYTATWAGSDLPPDRFMPAEDVAEMAWAAYRLSPRSVVEEILMRPQLGDIV
jgi:NAD(P)-dependent dehydrogenase (short-subunit alcohol dehydrogenase family)